MAVTKEKAAPYAPARTVLDVMSKHRAGKMPSPVTGEVLGRVGVTDSLIPRTLQALETLDLIDEKGAFTETFERLRLAPEAEYKERLAEWLNTAYADVLNFIDPATATDTEVRDAFRPYKPPGQQDRMVILFNGLYAAAGVRSEKESKQQGSQPSPSRPRTPAPARARPVVKPKAKASQTGETGEFATLPPMLAALLRDLPATGNGWTKERRDKVISMFPAVLDFAYPIVERPENDGADE